jgi:hypothetical protein
MLSNDDQGDVVYGGVGYHAARVKMDDPRKLTTWAKFVFIFPIVYVPAAALPKFSLLALYLRVFGTRTNPKSRMVILITIGIVALNMLVNFFITFGMCRPLAFLWNKKIVGGSCIDINTWWRWASLANIVTDLIMLFLPVPTIIQIQAPKKIKVGLAVTFLTGSR